MVLMVVLLPPALSGGEKKSWLLHHMTDWNIFRLNIFAIIYSALFPDFTSFAHWMAAHLN